MRRRSEITIYCGFSTVCLIFQAFKRLEFVKVGRFKINWNFRKFGIYPSYETNLNLDSFGKLKRSGIAIWLQSTLKNRLTPSEDGPLEPDFDRLDDTELDNRFGQCWNELINSRIRKIVVQWLTVTSTRRLLNAKLAMANDLTSTCQNRGQLNHGPALKWPPADIWPIMAVQIVQIILGVTLIITSR